jgi:hypothetical protein
MGVYMKKSQALLPVLNEGDFYQSINTAIAEKRHVEQLSGYMKEFEQYKKVFSEAFISMDTHNPEVFTFRVVYELKRPVWRVFEIFGSQTFNDFAEAIIESMDWDNDHMHEFSLPEKRGKSALYWFSSYSMYPQGWEDDPHPTYKTDEVCIAHMNYEKYPKIGFMFDFGDGHRFSILYQGKRPLKQTDDVDIMPLLIDQRGAGPEQYPNSFE